LAVGLFATASCSRASDEKPTIPGLTKPVEVLRDRWGISHIYAQNEHDLFLAQGYCAARDRLFQLELWRRQATGTLAELVGPRGVPGDVGSRLLRFKGDMTRELKHYHPRGDQIVAAFVEGINAYIDQAQRDPARLPLEFQVLGIKPGKWTPEIVVSRHNGLFRNALHEVHNAQLVQAIGANAAGELLNLHPGNPSLKPDDRLDIASVDETILKLYAASRAQVRFLPEDVLAPFRDQGSARRGASAVGAMSGALAINENTAQSDRDVEREGSNNWVVSGEHTYSRSAIMANDPHRSIQLPSLRYWVHLVAPGWNVIGAGEPALPGVSVGHNERGAWGFTIFPVDQEDIYVYETDPADPTRYRYRDGWESMTHERQTIVVKGSAAIEVTLHFTRHGPMILEDRARQKAYALKAAWLEEGTAPYLASLRLDQAASWEEFRAGCRDFLTPSENMVWADVEGHIGWQAVGLAPRRPNWNGLLPVPGDGRFEWQSYLSFDDLPHAADPPSGKIATANQDNLPRGFPFAVGFEWTDSFRFARIDEVLSSGRRFTLMDMMQLQHDEVSLPARSIVPLLRGLKVRGGPVSEARDQLLAWDFTLDRNSRAAAIYVVWERALKIGVAILFVPKPAQAIFSPRSLSTEKLIHWLTVPDGHFGDDPVKARDALLLSTLGEAIRALERRLGTSQDGWRYGQDAFKHVALKHPLSAAVTPELRARLDLGPLPRGGYSHTVNSTSDDDNQATGASFRIITDAADWDRSLGTNTPGQSGDPESPHYGDLFEPWAEGRYFPVFFSRPRVESVTESKVTLLPPSPG
jgi:penicillin amidase